MHTRTLILGTLSLDSRYIQAAKFERSMRIKYKFICANFSCPALLPLSHWDHTHTPRYCTACWLAHPNSWTSCRLPSSHFCYQLSLCSWPTWKCTSPNQSQWLGNWPTHPSSNSIWIPYHFFQSSMKCASLHLYLLIWWISADFLPYLHSQPAPTPEVCQLICC